VAARFNVVEDPETFERFNASWTPTVIIEDARGSEHRRSVGYLEPKRFIAELALGWLKAAIDRHDWAAAKERLPEVNRDSAGDAQREPEALYWQGMVEYEASGSHDIKRLAAGWKPLLDQFPDSEWAMKASYVRQQ
jgi:hypothetical protein